MSLESTVLMGEQESTRQRMYNNEATSLKRPPQHFFFVDRVSHGQIKSYIHYPNVLSMTD